MIAQRLLVASAVAVAMVLTLAGCVSNSQTSPSASTSPSAAATPPAPSATPDAAAQASNAAFAAAMAGPVQTWRTSYQSTSMAFSVPGTVVAASRAGGPVDVVASGDAVIGTLPLTADDAFHIGSMTKLFTAALIMQLDEAKTLSLSNTIDKWLPDAPNASTITVQMLLEHESGLYELDFGLVGVATTQEVLDNVFAQAPIAPPGTEYQYLNAGYIILGRIAELATGKPYGQLVDDHLIRPLGLTNTYLDGYGSGPEAVAGYDLACDTSTGAGVGTASGSDCLGKPSRPGATQPSPQWTGAWSAGGIVSTARDQAVWIRDLVAGDVVDAAHRALMQNLTPLSAQYYGNAYASAGLPAVQLGEGAGLASWSVPGVGTCFGHAGAIPGSNGIAAYCPDAQLAIVLLNTIDPAGTTPGYPGLTALAPTALAALGG